MDSLIRTPVTRLLSIGVNQMLAGLVDTTAIVPAGGDGYGSISSQGKREMVGDRPISLDPKISFFEKQTSALDEIMADAGAALEEALDDARDSGDDPEVLATLRRLNQALSVALNAAGHIQANATMAQWMSFLAQTAHGSQQVGGRSATDLSYSRHGDQPLTDRKKLLVLTIEIDVTKPYLPPRVVSAQYDGLEHPHARNRILSMPLLELNVPTKVVAQGFALWAARNEGGQITFGDAFSYLGNKGRRYDANGKRADIDKWDQEGWSREGARRMLEEEIMNMPLGKDLKLAPDAPANLQPTHGVSGVGA